MGTGFWSTAMPMGLIAIADIPTSSDFCSPTTAYGSSLSNNKNILLNWEKLFVPYYSFQLYKRAGTNSFSLNTVNSLAINSAYCKAEWAGSAERLPLDAQSSESTHLGYWNKWEITENYVTKFIQSFSYWNKALHRQFWINLEGRLTSIIFEDVGPDCTFLSRIPVEPGNGVGRAKSLMSLASLSNVEVTFPSPYVLCKTRDAIVQTSCSWRSENNRVIQRPS